MSEAPIKVCDFCDKQGKMPTYQNGMTICWGCQKSLPGSMQEALHEIAILRSQVEQLQGRCAELSNLCERLQHCAQGFYVDQGDYGHMEAIMLDYHAIMRGDATHPTDSPHSSTIRNKAGNGG